MAIIFELDEPCRNCGANTWRIGRRVKNGLTEFLCCYCGDVEFTNTTLEEFEFLLGAPTE